MTIKFTEEALRTLRNGYLQEWETPFDMFDRVINRSVEILTQTNKFTEGFLTSYKKDLTTAFYNGWLGGSTPVLANFGANTKALPISCFVIYAEDSISSIYGHVPEVAKMAQRGGGVGAKLNARPEGTSTSNKGLASGPVSFYRGYDQIAETVSQGGTRRGAFAFFMDINHPDVEKFLRSRDHSIGDPRAHIHSNIGLDIPDSFMELVGKDKEITNLWFKTLTSRVQTGTPYMHFLDNHNRARSAPLEKLNIPITGTNICTEISSAATDDLSMVCCLSSLNLELWEEWSEYEFETGLSLPFLGIVFLDSVMEEFITKSVEVPELSRARDYAIKGRPLGLGVLGWHGFLIKNMIPFEDEKAYEWNKKIFGFIHKETVKATVWLGEKLGCSEWGEVTGWRNIQMTAIAPTVSNSAILGAASAGVTPIPSNAYLTKGAKGLFKRVNPYLVKLLKEKYNFDKEQITEVINQVIEDNGSVQNIDFFSDLEKSVFKTAREIDQMDIVRQAADRQEFLTQTQSVNLFMDSSTDPQVIHDVHYAAWKLGLPTLYYNYSDADTKKKAKELREKQDKYVVISMKGCPYCVKAIEFLESQSLYFEEIDKEDPRSLEYKPLEGFNTYPRIFIKKKDKLVFIGGYENLIKYDGKGFVITDSGCLSCDG